MLVVILARVLKLYCDLSLLVKLFITETDEKRIVSEEISSYLIEGLAGAARTSHTRIECSFRIFSKPTAN